MGGGEERDNPKKAHIEIQGKEEKTPSRHSCVCLGVLARRAPIHAAALVAGGLTHTHTHARFGTTRLRRTEAALCGWKKVACGRITSRLS